VGERDEKKIQSRFLLLSVDKETMTAETIGPGRT